MNRPERASMSAVGVLTSPRREALHLFLIIVFLLLLFFFLDGLWFFEGLLEDDSLDWFTIVYYPILFLAPPAIAAWYGRRIHVSWLAFVSAFCPFLVLGLCVVVSYLFSLQQWAYVNYGSL